MPGTEPNPAVQDAVDDTGKVDAPINTVTTEPTANDDTEVFDTDTATEPVKPLDSDPSTLFPLVCEQILQQGLVKAIAACMSSVIQPGHAIDLLKAVQITLRGNVEAQEEFEGLQGYEEVSHMLLRVEANRPKTPALTTANLTSYAPGSDSFAEYITHVSTHLLLIILDHSSHKPHISATDEPASEYNTCPITNLFSVKVLLFLIKSRTVSGITIAIRVVYTLLHMNPLSVVVFEMMGVMEALCLVCTSLVLYGPQALSPRPDKPRLLVQMPATATSLSAPVTPMVSPHKGPADDSKLGAEASLETKVNDSDTMHRETLDILSHVLLVLQQYSVITSHRDPSILTLLAHLSLTLAVLSSDNHIDIASRKAIPSTHANMRKSFDTAASSSSLQSYIKCQNCDSEQATVECIHAMCCTVHEPVIRMCRECDRVFHKAVAKRMHIRLPIYDTIFADAYKSLKQPDLLSQSFVSSSFLECDKAMDGFSGVDMRSSMAVAGKVGGCVLLDDTMSLLLGTFKALVDDRKARKQSICPNLFDPILLSLRVYCTVQPSTPVIVTATQAIGSSTVAPVASRQSTRSLADSTGLSNKKPSSGPSTAITHERTNIADYYHTTALTSSSSAKIARGEHADTPNLFTSPRRVALSLYMQLFARYITADGDEEATDDALDSFKSSVAIPISCIASFRRYGGEALLAHMLIDNLKPSSSTTTASTLQHSCIQLTDEDQQFAIWLLRECVVRAVNVKDDSAVELLRWLLWLLQCPVSSFAPYNTRTTDDQLTHKQTATEAMKYTSRPSFDTSSALPPRSGSNMRLSMMTMLSGKPAIKHALFPTSKPMISPLLKLYIMQELKLLLCGDSYTALDNDALKHCGSQWLSLPLKGVTHHLDKQHHQQHHIATNAKETVPLSSAKIAQRSRTNSESSFPSQHNSLVHTFPSFALSSNTTTRTSFYARIPVNVSTAQELLIKAGGVDVLVKHCFGELCTPLIKDLFQFTDTIASRRKLASSRSGTVLDMMAIPMKYEALDDSVMDEWFLALSLLWGILHSSDDAKAQLNQYTSVKGMIRVLFSLMRDNQMESLDLVSSDTYTANNILINMILEVCVHGQLTPHRRPYLGFSESLLCPQTTPQKSDLSKSVTGTQNSFGPRSKISCLWRNQIFQYLVSNVSLCRELDEDSISSRADLSCLAPLYHAPEQLVIHVMSLVRPVPVTLSYLHHTLHSSVILSTTTSGSTDVYATSGDAALPSSSVFNMWSLGSERVIPLKDSDTASRHSDTLSISSSTHNMPRRPPLRTSSRRQLIPPSPLTDGALVTTASNPNVFNGVADSVTAGSVWESESVIPDRESVVSYHSQSSLLAFTHLLRPSECGSVRGEVAPITPINYVTRSISRGSIHNRSFTKVAPEANSTPVPLSPTRPRQGTTTVPEALYRIPLYNSLGKRQYYAHVLLHICLILYVYILGWTMNGVFQKSMLIFHAAMFYKSGLSYTELSDLLEDEQFLMGDGAALPFDDCEMNRDSSVTKTEGRNSIPLYILGSKTGNGVDDGVESVACFGPNDVEEADYTAAMVGKQKLLLLRQQLNQFCPPEKGQYDPQHTGHSKATPPSYSAVEFRSDESLDHLLSLAISSKGDTQHVLFTAVSRMVDSNPSNSAVFIRHASKHVVALIRLIPHLPEKQCMMVAYLVCQILRIHTHYRAVEELIQVACQAEDNDTDADGADDAPFIHLAESGVPRASDTNPHRPQLLIIERLLRHFSSSSAPYLTIQNQVTHPATAQALYILGQSTKTDCPTEYLHFTASNPFKSGLSLNPISHFPDPAVGYTVCTWVKLGDMGDKPFMTLMQLSPSSVDMESFQSNAVLDMFFRLVQKTNSDSTNAAGQYPGSNSPKASNARSAQLCISISHLTKLATSTQSPSIFDSSKTAGHALTAVSVPLSWSRIYPFGASAVTSSADIGPSDTRGFDLELSAGLSEWVDIARQGVEQLSGTERNDVTLTTEALSHQRTTSLLPPSTLQRASSIESTAYSAIEPELTGIVSDPAFGVISSLSRCLMPDLVIDHDWIEGEQWHLLCVHHSGDDIKVWVDGQEKVILPWSYQGHSSNPQTQIELATTTADESDPKQYSESDLFDDIIPSLPQHNTSSQEYIATSRKQVAKLGYPLTSRVSSSCPYELHIGYLYAEQESYRGLLQMIEQSGPRLKADYSNILQTHHTFISGYSGGLGDTYILAGRLDIELMTKAVSSGAQNSLISDDLLAGCLLSKLLLGAPAVATTTRLPVEPESPPAQAPTALKQPTPTKLSLPLKRDPASTPSPNLTPRKPDRFSILRGSTPTIADALVGVGAGKDKPLKDFADTGKAVISTTDVKYSPSVFHGEAVSRHQTVILSSALLQSSAGLAVLYPLLFSEKATQVVT